MIREPRKNIPRTGYFGGKSTITEGSKLLHALQEDFDRRVQFSEFE